MSFIQILVLLVGGAFVYEFYLKYKSKQVLEETKKKDNDLKGEFDKVEKDVKQLDDEIENLKKKRHENS